MIDLGQRKVWRIISDRSLHHFCDQMQYLHSVALDFCCFTLVFNVFLTRTHALCLWSKNEENPKSLSSSLLPKRRKRIKVCGPDGLRDKRLVSVEWQTSGSNKFINLSSPDIHPHLVLTILEALSIFSSFLFSPHSGFWRWSFVTKFPSHVFYLWIKAASFTWSRKMA